MRSLRIGMVLAAVQLVGAGNAGAGTVFNGSFESQESGWALSGNVGAAGGGVVGASDGLIAAQFNGGDSLPNAVVSQSILTVPGEAYTLEFDYGVYGTVATGQSLRVEAIGTTLLAWMDAHGTSAVPTNWQRHALEFVADSPTTLLTFTDIASPPTTFAVDGALDNIVVTGPVVPRPTQLLVQVEYSVPSILFGPISFGLIVLPDTFVSTFVLDGFGDPWNVVAGLDDVATSTVRFGDGHWINDLTSFSLVTDGTGEVTTLSYATSPLTTPTAVAGPILNSSFSATIEGTDIASGLDFEYHYAASIQTLAVLPPDVTIRLDAVDVLWDDQGVPGYDVVRGALSTLRTAGFTDSTLECLADDLAGTGATHAGTDPPPGEAWWYLLRVVLGTGPQSYDGVGLAQLGGRDAGINASLDACP